MSLLKSAQIRLMGLQRRSDLNGTRGIVVAPGEKSTILTIPERCLLSVNYRNLELHSDNQISVCAGCRQDFWSWETHGGWAGWTKAGTGKRGKYLCPRCGVDAQGSSWAFAQSGSNWASASAQNSSGAFAESSASTSASGNGFSAQATAGGGTAQATASGESAQATAGRQATAGAPGRVAQAVQGLASKLQAAFALPASRPLWMREPSDSLLRAAGTYDPVRGLGVEDEMDWGNFSGSVLVLALLHPLRFGHPETPPLTIFGDGLLELGTAALRSGKGPDNCRTNAVEALLNYFQLFPEQEQLRQTILETWRLVRLAVFMLEISEQELPQEYAQRIVLCCDTALPPGPVADIEMMNLYKVRCALTAFGRQRLRELPVGNITRSEIGAIVGFSSKSQMAALLQEALYECAWIHNGYGSFACWCWR